MEAVDIHSPFFIGGTLVQGKLEWVAVERRRHSTKRTEWRRNTEFFLYLGPSKARPLSRLYTLKYRHWIFQDFFFFGIHQMFIISRGSLWPASLLALYVGRRRPLSYALGITFLRLERPAPNGPLRPNPPSTRRQIWRRPKTLTATNSGTHAQFKNSIQSFLI